ncbi:cytochrome c-553I [bacterium MnTg02]|nr:cytochrome c-553I [bacterium MnTg02]
MISKLGKSGGYLVAFLATAMLFHSSPLQAAAAGSGVRSENGKYLDKDDVPTYNVKEDGTVDWYTYNGYRRYHQYCHVCHGPDALGSSFAPPLKDTLTDMTYEQFQEIVVNGRTVITTSKQNVMPAFGDNLNVMCFLDDLYAYVKARSDDAIPRGRPQKKEAKSDQTRKEEDECYGG